MKNTETSVRHSYDDGVNYDTPYTVGKGLRLACGTISVRRGTMDCNLLIRRTLRTLVRQCGTVASQGFTPSEAVSFGRQPRYLTSKNFRGQDTMSLVINRTKVRFFPKEMTFLRPFSSKLYEIKKQI